MQNDRLDKKRQSRIGTIEITRCEASYVKEEYREIKGVEFNQATKKDAYKVTEGKYTMSTTKKGRYIHRSTPYDVQLKKLWRVGPESSRLTVHYRMGHTLQDMGLELKPIDWSRVIVRRRSSSGSASSPSTTPPVSPSQTTKDASSTSPKSTTIESQKVASSDCDNEPTATATTTTTTTKNSITEDTSTTDTSEKVDSGELSVNYSTTTKIKEEPQDIPQQSNMAHIQLVATTS